ncbi:Dph6-related ATP pyrophosphatase [Rossellomorea sp. NS-SX7]|uniref:Dph6-related ATP pyrophosphatase n=1 Tax=Rossellomorea sp. NS-SX7 TaxID=3463856 RepID=UPI00405843BA
MKTVIGFSGGKDSTLALYKIQQNPEYEVDSLLVTLTEGFGRVSIHGVRYELLKQQSESLGIPLREVWIPQGCTNEVYQERMERAVSEMRDDGVTHIVFGDIHLKDVREYRETMMTGTGITPVFPLWNRPVEEISREFIDLSFKTVITCVDMDQIDRSFAGRVYDESFIGDYPVETQDICGENGEFHSFVYDGPNFSFPIEYELGEERVSPDHVTKRDRFLYKDVIPK